MLTSHVRTRRPQPRRRRRYCAESVPAGAWPSQSLAGPGARAYALGARSTHRSLDGARRPSAGGDNRPRIGGAYEIASPRLPTRPRRLKIVPRLRASGSKGWGCTLRSGGNRLVRWCQPGCLPPDARILPELSPRRMGHSCMANLVGSARWNFCASAPLQATSGRRSKQEPTLDMPPVCLARGARIPFTARALHGRMVASGIPQAGSTRGSARFIAGGSWARASGALAAAGFERSAADHAQPGHPVALFGCPASRNARPAADSSSYPVTAATGA
jgi:hypothetical protein